MSDTRGSFGLLRHRSMAAFVTAGASWAMALSCAATGLGLWVFDLTGREIHLGLLGLAEFLPGLLLVVIAGSLADSHDRRRVGRWAIGAELIPLVVLGLLARTADPNVWLIQLLVLGIGVARAFVGPSLRSMPADLVERSDVPGAIALSTLSWQSARIIGPILGGFAYAVGPQWVFAVSVALLAVSLAALLMIGPTRQVFVADHDRSTGWSEAWRGLSVIRETPILAGAITLDLFAVLFGGAVALLPALGKERLGIGPVGVGWLQAAGAIGAALMTVALARRPPMRHIGRTLLVAVGTFGAATVTLGLARSFAVAAVAIVVLSASDAISVVIRASIVPLVVPDDARGRVIAVEQVFIGASNELGGFESGVTGQLVGAAAVILGGLATLVVVAVWPTIFPALARADRFSDLSAHPVSEDRSR